MSLALSILALGVIIIVHEAGHMMVALWSGMRVERFSIGFGPVVARKKLHGVVYQIAAIPLGGFVQIAGMNPHEQLPPDDAGSYENKSLFRRMATIFAGPGINYVFAFVLGVVLFAGFGDPVPPPAVVGSVMSGAPAEKAGLAPDDRMTAIDGTPVDTAEDVRRAVMGSGGRPLTLRVRRGDRTIDLPVTPVPAKEGYQIGVRFSSGTDWRPLPLPRAIAKAAMYPVEISQGTLRILAAIVTRKTSTKDVGGPVMIVQQLKGSFDHGIPAVLLMLVHLNVAVGLFNLLPLPALDGGRLAFLAYSVVTRRRVNVRFEAAVHTVGFLLLFGLILVITFRDISRIFGG